MSTEAARRSARARRSVQGPESGWPRAEPSGPPAPPDGPLISAIGLGTTLGMTVAYLRVLRLEHRLGVRLYRERPRGVFGFRTSRVGYAGPPSE